MQTVNLTVTPQAFNTIMAGLEELPHKVSRGVIDELITQVKTQTEPKPADPQKPADAPAAADQPAADAPTDNPPQE